jgi:hypothetical protein
MELGRSGYAPPRAGLKVRAKYRAGAVLAIVGLFGL